MRCCRARSEVSERARGAPAPRGRAAATGGAGGAVRRAGRAGPSVPGGPARGPSATARTRRDGCWRCWGPTPGTDLIAALERAVRYGAYSHAAVERILSVQARPRTVLESLAEEERRLPPWLGEDPVSPGRRRTTNTSAKRSRMPMKTPNIADEATAGDGAAPEDP